jgi:hypothetical protein
MLPPTKRDVGDIAQLTGCASRGAQRRLRVPAELNAESSPEQSVDN